MISGELMKSLERPVKTKFDAYRFESGRTGLTKSILAMGKIALVVGKDGKVYEKEAWHESKTVFQADQENLLIADNQTRMYECATPDCRRALFAFAWFGVPCTADDGLIQTASDL